MNERRGGLEVLVRVEQLGVHDFRPHALSREAGDRLDVVRSAVDANLVHVRLHGKHAIDVEHLAHADHVHQGGVVHRGFEQVGTWLERLDDAAERFDTIRDALLQVEPGFEHLHVVLLRLQRGVRLADNFPQDVFQLVGGMIGADPADERQGFDGGLRLRRQLDDVRVVGQEEADDPAGFTDGVAIGLQRLRDELDDEDAVVRPGREIWRRRRDAAERIEVRVAEFQRVRGGFDRGDRVAVEADGVPGRDVAVGLALAPGRDVRGADPKRPQALDPRVG